MARLGRGQPFKVHITPKRIVSTSYTSNVSVSMMNAASRSATVARVASYIRSASVSMFISAGRRVVDYLVARWGFFWWS